MSKTVKILKNYLVLCHIDHERVAISRLNKIYILNLNNLKISKLATLRSNWKFRISLFSKVLRRFFRTDIRYGIKIDDEVLLIAHNKYFYKINIENGNVHQSAQIPRGTRPLNVCVVNEDRPYIKKGIYFGEYFSNPSKSEVYIYRLDDQDTLKISYKFEQGCINHIHNLIIDDNLNCLWVLTGDFQDGAAIYQLSNNFNTCERIVYGAQDYRSCVAFPIKNGLLYATDSQFQQNKIFTLIKNKQNIWELKCISNLNGPSIFGTKLRDKYIFSTSVEAINDGNVIQKIFRRKSGPGILLDQSEIVIGSESGPFKTIYTNKKDSLPFILFQFGNIIFPSGVNETNFLLYSNLALSINDLSTEIKNYDIL